MTIFLKKNDISVYVQYLKWRNLKNILFKFKTIVSNTNVEEVNRKAIDIVVTEMCAYTRNRKEAEYILQAFCKENNIIYR